MVWLEPHRVHVAGSSHPIQGWPSEERLAKPLNTLPLGPSTWVVDDLWAPSLILRDIVELPPQEEAREAFFRWRFMQTLALTEEQSVQALSLEEGAWLLTGLSQERRESLIHTTLHLGRPIHSLVPRWLWIYNRLAGKQELPGMLLSLCQAENGQFTGTLAAWGRTLCLLRQWAEPASPEVWMDERVTPSAAFLQREGRPPQQIAIWGASTWPETLIPQRILQPEIPTQEAL
jgi:hypothetical protein